MNIINTILQLNQDRGRGELLEKGKTDVLERCKQVRQADALGDKRQLHHIAAVANSITRICASRSCCDHLGFILISS